MPTASPVARPKRAPSSAERGCLLGLAALIVVAFVVPRVEQPAAYHAFADTRTWLGVPNAANVLSNIAFVLSGALIFIGLRRPLARMLSAEARAALAFVVVGILLTAWGSAWYHAAPGNATLVWDRLPMTVTFAGVLGVLLSQRVSRRAAIVALPLLLVLGAASVGYWKASGNVVPYAAFQLGTMLGLMLIVVVLPNTGDPFPWWWIIAGYAAAKIGETFDEAIFDATRQVVSGHTLKHVFAALAVAGFAWPLWRRARQA